MNIKKIVYLNLNRRLKLKEKILLKIFKKEMLKIYRIGFYDGFEFNSPKAEKRLKKESTNKKCKINKILKSERRVRMRNIKLTIEYDGKDFNGWQKQPNKLNIQGEIERAIEGVTKEKVELYASGRTDAGVHAFGQVANFKTNSSIPINKMATAINSQLKYSIRIKNAEEVDIGFHSRYNCKEKTYAYVINNEEQASAIFRNMEYHFPKKLDVEKMKEAAIYFIGEHDFAAFKSSGTSSKSSVRTIYNAEVVENNGRIIIKLTGNGFLYNMVRIISGTLLEVGQGTIKPEEIEKIIQEKDRKKAGKTLPPQGLYLVKVEYA